MKHGENMMEDGENIENGEKNWNMVEHSGHGENIIKHSENMVDIVEMVRT